MSVSLDETASDELAVAEAHAGQGLQATRDAALAGDLVRDERDEEGGSGEGDKHAPIVRGSPVSASELAVQKIAYFGSTTP
jgi:hypothetical protein